MIEYVDVAVVAFIKNLFPDFIVAMGPPDDADKVLNDAAIKALNKTPKSAPRNTRGIPGIVVFRTDVVPNEEIKNKEMIRRGLDYHNHPSDHPTMPDWISRARLIPVIGEYSIKAITYHRTEADLVEREIFFMDDYTTVGANIKGNPFNWAIAPSEYPKTSWKVTNDTGKVERYETTAKLDVDTFLLKSADIPPVKTIITKYQEYLDGAPVDLEDLTTVAIL